MACSLSLSSAHINLINLLWQINVGSAEHDLMIT